MSSANQSDPNYSVLPIEVLGNPSEGEIASAGVTAHSYPEPLLSDMHQAFELGVILTGSQERHYQGLVIPSFPGDAYLCTAWEPHGCRTTAAGTSLLVVFFVPEFLGDEVLNGMSWLTLFASPVRDRPRVTKPETRRQILQVAAEIADEAERRERGWMTALRIGVIRLLFVLSRHWEPVHPRRRQPVLTGDLARIAPAVHLLESRIGKRVSVAEAAAACALSVPQFCRVFRHSMGMGYGTFVTRSRLGLAARLLLATREPVAALAARLGFVDASHLHRVFAGAYGCTPSQYRNRGTVL